MPRAKRYRPTLTFIQDSRETVPFRFGPLLRPTLFCGGLTKTEGLKEADYAVEVDGTLLPVRVERKELGDLFGVVGYGRERFERELERLIPYDFKAIVVEATLDDVLKGYERSQIPGRTAAASLIAWQIRYNVHVIYAENHRRAAGYTQRLLEQAAVDWWGKNAGR